MAAAVYVDESFPKTVEPFGGNPGSAGHFRLKHGTDVIARLAAGEVPQDFDAIDGAEVEVEAKGPMLMMGADAVWEWTGANAPGFGDPLTRHPDQVEVDIATGALATDTAERVYGVVPGDGATQTLQLRAERLAARLADAVPPAGTPTAYGRPRVRHPGRPGRLPDAIPRVPVPGHRPARGLRDHQGRRRSLARHRHQRGWRVNSAENVATMLLGVAEHRTREALVDGRRGSTTPPRSGCLGRFAGGTVPLSSP
jgi:hypothetical protein